MNSEHQAAIKAQLAGMQSRGIFKDTILMNLKENNPEIAIFSPGQFWDLWLGF